MIEHTMSGQTANFCDVGRISAAFGDTKNAIARNNNGILKWQ